MLLPFSVAAFAVGDQLNNSKERRLALVMGNSQYDGLDDLPNVKNDTDLISSKLKGLGFQTEVVLNASRREMLTKINEFGQQLDDNDVGLFYYAGHAVQQGSANYLIPSQDVSEMDQSTLEFDAVDLNRVVAQMRVAASDINIIILDACRDNPFKDTSANRGIGQTKGLAAPTANVRGMYIAYSTSPGSVAADGDYDNSPYTSALASYIDEPGLGINEIFTKVRSDVIEQTNNKQIPWEMSSLTADFYFSDEQTEEEKSNELEIEAEMARLRELLEQERQAKIAAEEERKKAVARLNESQDKLALEKSLIEQQKKAELEQIRIAELEQERLKIEAEKNLAQEQIRKQEELDIAQKKQFELEKAEQARLVKIKLEEEALAKEEQERLKIEEEKAIAAEKKRQQELVIAQQKQQELEKAEQARLLALEKLAFAREEEERLKKEAQEAVAAEQKVKQEELEIVRLKQLELKRAEEERLRLEQEKAIAAEKKRQEELAIAKQKQLELEKAEQARLAKIKLEQEALARAEQERLRIEAEKALAAEQKRKQEELARAKQKQLEIEKAREARLAEIKLEEEALAKAEQELIEREKQLQAAILAQEEEARRLAKLAQEEEERKARQEQLVLSMVNNCDRFLANSSSGKKVLSCYQDVLGIDQNNAQAIAGLLELEKLYQAKITESINQGKLSRVNREYAVLEAINPMASEQMFGSSVESLQEELRKSSEESSRLVLPTF